MPRFEHISVTTREPGLQNSVAGSRQNDPANSACPDAAPITGLGRHPAIDGTILAQREARDEKARKIEEVDRYRL